MIWDSDREMDALEFVGRLYTEATRFARRYEYRTQYGTERRRFADWFAMLGTWLPDEKPHA